MTAAVSPLSVPGFHRLAVRVLLAGIGLGVGIVVLVPHGAWSATALNILNVVASALAARYCLRRAPIEQARGRGWRLMGVAALAQAVYQAAPVVQLIATGFLPTFPGPADWLSLAVLPLVGAGMFQWHVGPLTRAERLRTGLDATLFAGSVFFLVWQVALAEVVASSGISRYGHAVLMGGFLLIAGDLGIVVYLVARRTARLAGPLGWLFAFLLTGTVANLLIMLLGLRGRYYTGHPSDVMVTLSLVMLALAPLSPRPVATAPAAERGESNAALLLPYLPVAGAVLAGSYRLMVPGPGQTALAWMAGVLLTILLVRQFLGLRDVMELTRTLERKVAERTAALEQSRAALEQAQRLEAVGRMAGGTAHDFNNLLHAIQSWADILAATVPADAPHREAVDEITATTQRAQALTRQLLTFASRQPVSPVGVDLNAFTREAAPLLARLAGERVRLDLRPDATRSMVRADPAQLEQLLTNLTVNARDAMPQGGTLTIATRDGAPDPVVRLTVADTGTGMDPQVAEHIFEPFFTTKAPGRGSGIGLATCYGIASRAGGRITVITERGSGTMFTVELPLMEGA